MRREVDHRLLAAQLRQRLLDLRRVSMRRHSVCFDAVVELREVIALIRLAPRAAHTRLRVNHNRVRIDQMMLGERSQREDRCRRVTAGVCNDLRAFDILAIEFRQAVNTMRVPMRVLDVIPLLVNVGIGEAIIRAEINYPRRKIFELLADVHCMPVRQRDKNKIAVGSDCLDVFQTLQLQIENVSEMRIKIGNDFARVTFRCNMRDIDLRMAIEDRKQFRTGISRCADDAHFNHYITSKLQLMNYLTASCVIFYIFCLLYEDVTKIKDNFYAASVSISLFALLFSINFILLLCYSVNKGYFNKHIPYTYKFNTYLKIIYTIIACISSSVFAFIVYEILC